MVKDDFDYAGADAAYLAAFERRGLWLAGSAPPATATRIQASALKPLLLSALDDWTSLETEKNAARRLLELTARIETENRWRKRLLDPGVLGKPERRQFLLEQIEQAPLAPSAALLLAAALGLQTEEAQRLMARVLGASR